jgi:D-tagatose-1,6-bisphosphate aldolase subunit GatZ/KbaZ
MANTAMTKSICMVQAYIQAGYRKIHLDTSIACADDPGGALSKQIAAQRAADLCQMAEAESRKLTPRHMPVYVIGTEVPTPGGAIAGQDHIRRTTPQEAAETLMIFSQEFKRQRLEQAWERVIALVVQPGVEFGDKVIDVYDRTYAAGLTAYIRQVPGIIYEAHSTDYQPPIALRHMVEDQFAILKVGPALTFAFREAVFALESIEKEWMKLHKGKPVSSLKETILACMAAQPIHWSSHYHGSASEIAFNQVFSYSDRIRYYWNFPQVRNALALLITNLHQYPPPMVLLSQYLPAQYLKVQSGQLGYDPQEWIWDYIQNILNQYNSACYPSLPI